MSIPVVGKGHAELRVRETRVRQTPKPVSTFSQVLRGSAQVLLAGAELATGMVGGSILSAAISKARTKLAGTSGNSAQSSNGLASNGSTNSEFDAMKQLQEQAKKDNLFFLELQQKMQQENRKFSTVSNILKAKHDTARAAINNIRA